MQNKQSPERNLRRFSFDTGAPAPDPVNFFYRQGNKSDATGMGSAIRNRSVAAMIAP